ncbi:MAG: hypothetical protein AAFU61_02130, partial [Pseudomonadota bacterium]
ARPPTAACAAWAAGPTAVAFDAEARLAEFAGGPADYAEMPGRLLVRLLAEGGANLAVNPGVSEWEVFHETAALTWMVEATGAQAAEAAASGALAPPAGAGEALVQALDAKLAALGPALAEAWLAERRTGEIASPLLVARERGAWGDGEAGDRHRAALAAALGETARLAAPDALPLEVAFAVEGDAILASARRLGLGFALPEPDAPGGPTAPGMNPDAPPKLR